MSAGESSAVGATAGTVPVAAQLDQPKILASVLHAWRRAIPFAWALFILGFVLGLPADEVGRQWWSDGAWTIAYLAATIASVIAAIRLTGRDRLAWASFAFAGACWLAGQLVWNYYELIAHVSTPFPTLSDFFYLFFTPACVFGLMCVGEKPIGASLGPKLLSQLIMIGAAVFVAVGLPVSEALLASQDSGLYVVLAIGYPLLYIAAFLMGVLSLCLYGWGGKRLVLTLLVIGLGCHAVAETFYGLNLLGRSYEVGHAIDSLWLFGAAFQFWAAIEHIVQSRRGNADAPEEQFLIRAYRRARRLEPLVPALGIVLISLSLALDGDGLSRSEALYILTPACLVFAAAVAVAEGWSWHIEENLRHAAASAALAARRSESRLAAMLEVATAAIIAVDSNHMIRLCSKGAATLFGYAAKEMAGLPLSLLFGQEAGKRDAKRDGETQAAMKTQEAGLFSPLPGDEIIARLRSGDVKGRTQSGILFPIEGESCVLAADGGDGALTIIMLSDVTERRRQERTLRHAKESAEAANRAKTQFLANMSHELRTPLNAIIGFSEVISNKLFGNLDERYRDYASDIVASGRHLLGLINDILDLSKIDLGQATLSEGEVDLARAVQSCERLMRERAERGVVQVLAVLPDDLPLLWADETKVKQIVLNLLSNAVKFTERGGKVVIDAALLADGKLSLTVTDTGIGMRPEDIPKAMTPFGQLESTFERRFEGTGLGLPLVHRLVELHGAELQIDSQPGHGTRVEVCFPKRRVVTGRTASDRKTGAA